MVKLWTVSFYFCVYILLTIQVIAIVVAFKKTSNVNEYTVKNQRTRMRQNYIVQQALNHEDAANADALGIAFAPESYEPDTRPEELPALIVDYGNMIRNDIILMDNSVQTRTRKSDNVKTQGVMDVPCSCEEEGKKLLFLGEEYVPRSLETRHCDDRLCPAPYGCRIRSHNVTVLKRKKYSNELSQEELPEELKRRWVAVKKPVTVGCTCSKGYLEVYGV